ncbi:MAG: ribosomal protein L31 [Candidatus Deianiraeaceae bacterium]|jgi:ribosomal protein L31
MAKKGIHPEIQGVSYVFLDGLSVEIPSCYAKSNKFVLEVDIFNHVAWRDDKQYVNESLGNIAKFKEKFKFSADAMSGVSGNKK